MSLWTASDGEAGKPKYLNATDKANTYGIDATEQGVDTSDNVVDISIVSGGTGYTAGDLVFTGGGFSAVATATFTATDGVIDDITITGGGVGYTSAPTVDGDAGGNADATFTVSLGEGSTAEGSTISHTGWNLRTVGSGGRAGRVSWECLVAGGMSGDATEDGATPDA